VGRPAKPLKLHTIDGKSRLTKSEAQKRQAGEIVLGGKALKPSASLRANKTALTEFRRIVKVYNDSQVDFLTDADVKLLERRCFAHADYVKVRTWREQLMRKRSLSFEDKLQHAKSIDLMLARYNDQLQKMDRELLLTPLSRISGINRAAKKDKEDPGMQGMFGDG